MWEHGGCNSVEEDRIDNYSEAIPIALTSVISLAVLARCKPYVFNVRDELCFVGTSDMRRLDTNNRIQRQKRTWPLVAEIRTLESFTSGHYRPGDGCIS